MWRLAAGVYRGIHLTSQLSKVVERLLGKLFQDFFEKTGAYGPNQFAYMKGRGSRDALAWNVLKWLGAASRGLKLGIYCSDVSGAFDRVSSHRLLDKLRHKGLHGKFVLLIQSWLHDRNAVVVVDGSFSAPHSLRDAVYQGTVWGPPLWNCMYEDGRSSVNAIGFSETVFADDLLSYKAVGGDIKNDDILKELTACQAALHAWGPWGAANQISFDPSKESLHIIHRWQPYVERFKFLGVSFDTKLVMEDASNEIVGIARVHLQTLLRGKHFFT